MKRVILSARLVIQSARLVTLSAAKDLLLAVLALTTITAAAHAQALENRISSARGVVVFRYATDPNVCGDGSSIHITDDPSPGWTTSSRRSGVHVGTRRGGRQERCDVGPAEVRVERDGARLLDVRVSVGGQPERGDTDLGDVSPADAARYLLDIAPRLTGRAADNAVMGAEIADGVVVWPRMLQIARDNAASESARKAAVFWVSHEAGAAATVGLDSLVSDDDAALSVRKDALFYLAQRPNHEGIPGLIKVAEGSKNGRLRKDAIFYLAQSRDPRALDLFERLLTGR